MSHQQQPPAQTDAAMARSCFDTQAKHQRNARYSQHHFEKCIESKQPMSRPALEPLDQFSERQQQRDTLRTAAQKSGKETDRAHTILEWGGNIQSTLSILPIERPFSDIKPAMLDRTWPGSFTKEARVQRASRPRVPLEPEYGESCDPYKGKKNQQAVVHAEEIFDFGKYFEDEAKRVIANRAAETGESAGCGMSNAGEEAVGGS